MISNPVIFNKFKDFLEGHPAYVFGGSSWGWVKASLETFNQLWRADLSRLSLPILHVSAEDEVTVSQKRQQEFLRQLPHVMFLTLSSKHDVLLGEPEVLEHLYGQLLTFIETT